MEAFSRGVDCEEGSLRGGDETEGLGFGSAETVETEGLAGVWSDQLQVSLRRADGQDVLGDQRVLGFYGYKRFFNCGFGILRTNGYNMDDVWGNVYCIWKAVSMLDSETVLSKRKRNALRISGKCYLVVGELFETEFQRKRCPRRI